MIMHRGIPEQAKKLVEKIKADPSIDVDNDWKLITLWIGGNDLCAVCKGEVSFNLLASIL